MKRVLTAALLCAAFTIQTHAAEPPRRHIRPYASVEEAAADAAAALSLQPAKNSSYIHPVTEFTREESEGRTLFSSTYVYPASWLNRQLLLRVESASAGYTVIVNGVKVEHVTDGTEAAEFNITKVSQQGINDLTLRLDSAESGKTLLNNGSTTPGIGRVEVLSQPALRLRDADVRSRLNEAGDAVVQFLFAVKTDMLNTKESRIIYELTAPDKSTLANGYRDVSLGMRGEDTLAFSVIVPRKWLWSADNPSLLTLTVRNRMNGRNVETVVLPIGVREVTHKDGTLYVNGNEVTLNTATVSGRATLKELQKLKSRGYNAVTVAAGDAAPVLYDICDALGLYVVAQAGIDTSKGSRSMRRGGSASNDPQYTDEYLRRTAAMYHTAKSHPSVVVFSLGHGVTNGINPYEAYMWIKRTGDERPTIYNAAGGEWNSDCIELKRAR